MRQLLRGLCAQEGSTVLTVTHDAGLAAGAGCVIALVDERVQESTPKA